MQQGTRGGRRCGGAVRAGDDAGVRLARAGACWPRCPRAPLPSPPPFCLTFRSILSRTQMCPLPRPRSYLMPSLQPYGGRSWAAACLLPPSAISLFASVLVKHEATQQARAGVSSECRVWVAGDARCCAAVCLGAGQARGHAAGAPLDLCRPAKAAGVPGHTAAVAPIGHVQGAPPARMPGAQPAPPTCHACRASPGPRWGCRSPSSIASGVLLCSVGRRAGGSSVQAGSPRSVCSWALACVPSSSRLPCPPRPHPRAAPPRSTCCCCWTFRCTPCCCGT